MLRHYGVKETFDSTIYSQAEVKDHKDYAPTELIQDDTLSLLSNTSFSLTRAATAKQFLP